MSHLKSCHCCGLIQEAPTGVGAVCARCETALESWLGQLTGNRLSAAFSMAALVLYLPAVMLPFLRIEQLGQSHESSLLIGVQTLLTEGQVLVGLIVLVFSIVFPLLKLSALLFLSQRRWQLAERHRALTYRLVEQLGRWGMLDVLLVAVMVAFIKLGGLVEFQAGPGIVAFTLFVLVSLIASVTFDPHLLWDDGVMLAADQPSEPSVPVPSPTSASASATKASSADTVPTAIVPSRTSKTWKPYLVWLIPAIAALIVGWLVWAAFADRGRLITVTFADGHGIEAGDEMRYHGIVVGEVERVTLSESLTGVVLDVRLTSQTQTLAREGTRFWIVRPQASLTGIGGLETIIGAKYLTLIPGPNDGPVETMFVGLEQPPLPDLEFTGGIEIVLQSAEALGLRPGLGVYYRGVRIGGVIETGLAIDGSAVDTRVYIRPDYRQLIREQTKFWNAGGIHIVGGLTELSVHIGTVETMLHGGIGVSIPPAAGKETPTGHRFKLHDRPEKEWLAWQPSIAGSHRRLPANRPDVLSATLRWTHDGVINRPRERRGWVMPTAEGLVGPRDLLMRPADAVADSVELKVGGEPVSPADPAETNGAAVVILPAGPRSPGSPLMRRITTAEDGFAIAGGAEPILIAASRLVPQAGGHWKIDSNLAINENQHGAVVISTRDGAVIGCLIVTADSAELWPVTQ